MRITTLVLLSTTLLATSIDAQRQREGRLAKREARSFRRLQVPAEEVAQNVKKLRTELRWHKSLGGALAAGRASRKPVVFIQALGELDGFL